MHERDGHRNGDRLAPHCIAMPMTRTDIADYLGISAEAVTRSPARLVRQGIVAFPDRHLVCILNPGELARLASMF